MAATFAWKERYGTSPGTEATATNVNFVSNEGVDQVPASNPIVAGQNSYEKWIKGDFSGTFNTVDNLQFFKSAGAIDAQADVKWKGDTVGAYVSPVATTSTVAVTDVPESDPGSPNVSINGGTGNQLSVAGQSDYIVLQYQATASHPAGSITQLTFTLQYDES